MILLALLLFNSSFLLAQIDQVDGPFKIYYPNGQVSSEGVIKDGKPDGSWITYYVTGVKKSEGKRKAKAKSNKFVKFSKKRDKQKSKKTESWKITNYKDKRSFTKI